MCQHSASNRLNKIFDPLSAPPSLSLPLSSLNQVYMQESIQSVEGISLLNGFSGMLGELKTIHS